MATYVYVVDALIDRYLTTVPLPERITLLGQIIYHVADQLTVIGLYYYPNAEPVANRLLNVTPKRAPESDTTWNVHEWDIKQ